jgi:hypothetical protein
MHALHPKLHSPTRALFAVALCALGLCALGATSSNAAGRYVAFGDSGTTGSGLGAQYPGSRPLCWQTSNSYPVFIANQLSISSFDSGACSAAWVNDFTTDQSLYNSNTGQYEDTAPPQFNKLNGSETLITISIGDNDSGYGDIVNNCVQNTTAATPCKDQYVTNGVNYFVGRANDLLSYPLGEAIDEAHTRSPNAEIWIVGYPRLFPEDVSNCPGRIGISPGDAPVVNAWQHAVNDTEKATAKAHGAYYLDVMAASTGHDACQPVAGDRWDNPEQSATPSGWALHPTLAGHTAVAALFVAAFNAPRPDITAPDAPTVTRTSPSASPTTSTSQTISIAAAESGGTLKCKLDGGAYATCTSSPISLTGLGLGPHTYSVTQTDAADNVSAEGAVSWSIGTVSSITPPGGLPGSSPFAQKLSITTGAKSVHPVSSKLAPITTTAPTKNGAKISVTLANAGSVEFFIDQAKPGRIKAGKCRSLSKRAGKGRKACTRYVSLPSSVTLSLSGGSTTVYFTGRSSGKQLSAGKYRVRAEIGSLTAKTSTFSLSK